MPSISHAKDHELDKAQRDMEAMSLNEHELQRSASLILVLTFITYIITVNKHMLTSLIVHISLIHSTATKLICRLFLNSGLEVTLLSSMAATCKAIWGPATGFLDMVMELSHWSTVRLEQWYGPLWLNSFKHMAQKFYSPMSGNLKCLRCVGGPLSELTMALNASLPVCDLMCPNGSLNMATHYPINGIALDMGE
jgi:hypothetical protein